jgi:hypothetical protein
MEEETQRWVQGGGDKPPPTKTQLVNEPLAPFVLVHVPLKRYGPFPVVGGFEVFAVPVHVELPAVPVNVVP